jgi:hypothetical protein
MEMTEKVMTNGREEKRSCGVEDGCLTGWATQSSSHLSGAPKLIDGGSGPIVFGNEANGRGSRVAIFRYETNAEAVLQFA